MAKANEQAQSASANDTPTAPAQPVAPETPAPRPAVIDNSEPVEISFITGLPKPPATPAGSITGEQAQPAEKPTTQAAEQPKTFTQADVDRLMGNLRKSIQKEMEEARQKEIENAKLSEQERLAKEKAEVEQQLNAARAELQAERTRVALIAAASGIGLDTDAAVKLVDTHALQFDDNGNVTNAAELVKAIAEKYPGLVKRGAPAIPAVNPSSAQQPAGRTDDDRRREYFGGGASGFWSSGGVKFPTSLGDQ